jgi:hypothetical protein
MSMRHFTGLTNAFSKKVEYLMHTFALRFMYYNIALVYQTLKKTPAMATGIAVHARSLEEIAGLLDSTRFKLTHHLRLLARRRTGSVTRTDATPPTAFSSRTEQTKRRQEHELAGTDQGS